MANFEVRSQYLTNKEASTALCSVVKHAGSGRARKKCRGKHETQSSDFPHFLSALPLRMEITKEGAQSLRIKMPTAELRLKEATVVYGFYLLTARLPEPT